MIRNSQKILGGFVFITILALFRTLSPATYAGTPLFVTLDICLTLAIGIVGVASIVSLMKRLRVLRHSMNSIAAGTFAPLPILHHDEIGKLIEDFNSMGLVMMHRRDETEFRLAQIREKEEAYYHISKELRRRNVYLSAISDGLCVVDRESVIIDVNESMGAMLGIPRDALPGKMFGNFFADDRRKDFLDRLNNRTPDSEQFCETVIRRADGSSVPVLISSARVVEETEGPACVLLVKDISPIKKAEERIVIFEQMIRGANDAITLVDLEGRIEFLNDAAITLFGIRGRDFIGMPIGTLVSPENRPGFAREIYLATMHGGWKGEIVNVKPDGSEYTISLSTSPVVDRDGKTISLVGIAHDITDAKKNEKALLHTNAFLASVLSGSLQYAIIATDPEGTITLFNRGAQALLGYAPEEVVGITTPEIFHREDEVLKRSRDVSFTSHTLIAGFNAIVAGAASGRADEREWTYVRKDGKHIPVLLSISRLSDARNETSGYLAVARSIGAQKAAENELKEREKYLRGILDTMGDALVTLDLDWKIQSANKAAVDLTGIPPVGLSRRRF